MMKYVEKGTGVNHSVAYEFDKLNNMTALVETINGTRQTTGFTYDEDNRPTSVTAGYSSRNCTYDGFGRVSQLATRHEGTNVFTQQYTYISNTNQISGVTFGGSWQNKTYSYTYDQNGNITGVSDGTYTTSYVYDSANQLIRENNREANTTTLWTYDDAGNITSRQVYPYTTGTPANRTQNVAYTYNNTNWGDLLTSYNGTAISYDNIGNPLNDGTWTYTWQHGRQLKTMAKSGETWQYTYNADGLRTKRTSGSRTYQYTYAGGQLTHMTVDGHTLYFTYDASGTPLTLTYDGNKFYYVTNLQGDVIAIVNGNGREFVRYTYDAWGNILKTEGSATNLRYYNPLRYRGYVYDPETGLYYVSSRYYDPEIGRWINADSMLSQETVLGNNMFAYCLNNPVNMSDPSGELPFFVITAAIGAVAGAIIGGVVAAQNGGNVWAGIGIGAAAGALIGTGAGMAAGVALAGSITATTGAVMAGGSALLASVATGGVGAGATYIANNLQSATNAITSAGATTADPIKNALKQLDASGLRPGQTEISRSKIMELVNSFDQVKAQSCIHSIGGTRYLVDGHHTTVASTILGKGTCMNMGMYTNQLPSATNIYWTKQWYEFWKITIKIME